MLETVNHIEIIITGTGRIYKYGSKKEPNKKEILALVKSTKDALEVKGDVKYLDFGQPDGNTKVYKYNIEEKDCIVIVSRIPYFEHF
jgi:hypothetical protein